MFVGLVVLCIFSNTVHTTIIFFSEKEKKIRTIKNCDIDNEIMKKKNWIDYKQRITVII